jgi:asparagine synthetase B (glutamine-hydrolysing)
MRDNPRVKFGDFSVFGITQAPEALIRHKLPARLGISPRTIDCGSAGVIFLHTSYGDVAETKKAIVLKLGLLRSLHREPLSAQQLLELGWVTPQSVNADVLRGNALVACFSKTSPEFCVYKTLLSVPQLYFSRLAGGVLCTDGPRPHIALLDRVAVNEEAIPQHFLFRYVLGRHTYFDGIQRLLCGEMFRWRDGRMETRLLRDLRPEPDAPSFMRADSKAMDALYGEMSSVMATYLCDIEQTGYSFATMLSGGVDSTIMQLLINDHVAAPERRKSLSYAMQTPEFEFEVGYAKEAAQRLETQHTFVTISPQDYPALLVETTETLGFPITAETYPCKLAIAKFTEENCDSVRFFFLGNGADSLHGTTLAKKVALLDKVRHLPASSLILKLAAALVNPLAAKKAHGLRQVANMLPELDDPRSYKTPANITAVYSNIEMARRAFGDESLSKAFEYRHYIEGLYLNSNHHNEKVHMIELLNDAYECGVVVNHLYLAHGSQQIYFYLDEDVIRIALAFDPSVRFVRGRTVKPLLKGILERTPLSDITKKPKGASVFNRDLHDWMRSGPLRDMVLSIERPGWLSKSDFTELLQVPTWSPLDEPNWFLWNLLIFDVFQKRVLGGKE